MAGINVEPVGETHENEGGRDVAELFELFDGCRDTDVEEDHPWYSNFDPDLHVDDVRGGKGKR